MARSRQLPMLSAKTMNVLFWAEERTATRESPAV
jgi:hypothetical protein